MTPTLEQALNEFIILLFLVGIALIGVYTFGGGW